MEREHYRVLVEKPDGKRALGWDDDIKMDLQEVGWGDIDWIALAQVNDRWQSL